MAGRDPAVGPKSAQSRATRAALDEIIPTSGASTSLENSEDRSQALRDLKPPLQGQSGRGVCWTAGGVKNTIPQADGVS
jgi:hypothetical protein